MFTKYLFYDIFLLIVSGCVAVAGWKIGAAIKKAKSSKSE